MPAETTLSQLFSHKLAYWGVYELDTKHECWRIEYNSTEDYILEICGVQTLSVIGEEILIKSRDSGGQLSSLCW